jgi:hypothetical protein
LVGIDYGVDVLLKPRGEDFGDSFHNAVLEGDRPEERGVVCGIDLGEEHEEGSVDPGEINRASVESVKNPKDVGRDKVPKGRVESGPKTIWAGAGVFVHIQECLPNFRTGELGA